MSSSGPLPVALLDGLGAGPGCGAAPVAGACGAGNALVADGVGGAPGSAPASDDAGDAAGGARTVGEGVGVGMGMLAEGATIPVVVVADDPPPAAPDLATDSCKGCTVQSPCVACCMTRTPVNALPTKHGERHEHVA